jgi:hypothetical protein
MRFRFVPKADISSPTQRSSILPRLLQAPDSRQHDRIALDKARVGTGADHESAERVS